MQPVDDAREKRRQELFAQYEAEGLETGMKLKGEQVLQRLEYLHTIDPEWAAQWLHWCYGFNNRREVIDDLTREMVVIGEHTVLGHASVLPLHIRTCLKLGASPMEILEVIWQAALVCGIPKSYGAMEIWRKIVTEEGHLELEDLVLKKPPPAAAS